MPNPEPLGVIEPVRENVAEKVGVAGALAIFKTKLTDDFTAIRRAAKYREAKAHVFLFRPSFHICILLRLQELVAGIPIVGPGIRIVLGYMTSMIFGCGISMGAKIGGGICFPHPVAVCIGECTIIGRNVTIYQSVTLGRSHHGQRPGQQIIEDDVVIGAGAVVLGDVTIGKGAQIGANAVVLKDVPAYARAVGNPARILSAEPPCVIAPETSPQPVSVIVIATTSIAPSAVMPAV